MADFVAMMRLAADFRAGVLALKEASEGVKALGSAARATSTDGAVLGRSFDAVKAASTTTSTALQTQIDRLTGVSTTERGAAASAGVFAAAIDGQARAFDQLRAAVAPAITAEEQFARAQEVVNAAVRAGIVDQQAANAVLDQAQIRYLGATMAVAKGNVLAAGSVGNLTAQFNDIGMMLAAGQNPLMLALQQGTSITQVFSATGGGAAGAVKMLGAAFMGLISPVNLVTLGVIAGGAALIQWGIKALSAGEDTRSLEEKVTDLTEATTAYKSAAEAAAVPIDELRRKYGLLAEDVQRALEQKREEARLLAQSAVDTVISDVGFNLGVSAEDINNLDAVQSRIDQIRARVAELRAESSRGKLLPEIGGLELAADRQQGALDRLKVGLADLASTYGITIEQAQKLAAATSELNSAQGDRAKVEAASALNAALIEVFGSIEAANEATGGLSTKLATVVTSGADVVAVTDEVNVRLGVAVGLAEDLATAFGQAETGIARVGNAALTAAARIGQAAKAAWDMVGAVGASARATTIPVDPRMNIKPGSLPVNPGIVNSSPVPLQRPMDLGDTGNGTGSAGSGGGGGGGLQAGSLAALQDEGKKALAAMALAVAGVNEKVQAGLLSTAEGVDAVDQAKERTANGLAELIPKIEAIGGPGSVTAVANLRAALKDLVGDIGAAGSELRDKLTDGIAGPFETLLVSAGKGKAAFADFTQSVLNNIAKIAAQRFTEKFISPIINTALSLFGLSQGGVVADGTVQAFAAGGVPGLPAWRNQVVDRPTLFALGGGDQTGLMGEAGPEAVMPLARGPRGLSVRATGPKGASLLPLQRLPGGVLGVSLPKEDAAAPAAEWRATVASRPPVAFAAGGVVGGTETYPMPGEAANNDPAPLGRVGGRPAVGAGWVAGDLNVRIDIRNEGEPVSATKTGQRMEGNTAVIEVLTQKVTGIVVSDIANGGDISGALTGRFGLQRRGQ